MKNIDELLIKLNACKAAQDWAKGKTFVEVYTTCNKGEWLNWLFAKTNPKDVQLLTLVKGHQANTVRHLMKDVRSREAIDTAIAFGEGRATKEQLSRAAEDAGHAAYNAADTFAASDAATAAYTAAASASASYVSSACASEAAAADASYASCAAAEAAHAARAAARQANQKQTADIFRKYIAIEKFKI